MRVLIAEDDEFLSYFLKKAFKSEGYSVEVAKDGRSCLESHAEKKHDLLLLDLGLPHSNGVDILESVTRGCGPAVIVLTASTSTDLAVRCLQLGAEDFIRKPFSAAELLARCKVVLKRRTELQDSVLAIGLLKLNRGLRTVHYGQIPIVLTVKEFALLELLMAHQGKCCQKEEIMQSVWQASSAENANIVEVYIRYLRRKLAVASDRGGAGVLIETLKGEGYRIVEQCVKA